MEQEKDVSEYLRDVNLAELSENVVWKRLQDHLRIFSKEMDFSGSFHTDFAATTINPRFLENNERGTLDYYCMVRTSQMLQNVIILSNVNIWL